jgi:tetratricopeptide (TPR) repeat protein
VRLSDQSRPPQEIAKELNVDALVVGTMTMVGDRIECTVSLVEAKSGMQVWADDIEEQAADLFGVERRIAMGTATKLKGRLTGHEEEELARPAARSAPAYELYLRGAFAMQSGGKEANALALEFFRKAVNLDPTLGEAYVGIGAVQSDRYFRGGEGGYRSLQEAEESYRRALAMDPMLVSALGGLVEVYWEKGMSEECLKQGEAAAHLGRDDVDTLFVRSQAYTLCGLPDKALPLLQRAIAIDPANPGAQWFLTLADAWSGRYRDATAAGEAFTRRFGDDPEVHTWIGLSYHSLGDLEQARIHYEKANDLFGEDTNFYVLMFTGNLYKQMGMTEKARETWLRGVEQLKPRLDAYPDNYRMRGLLAWLYCLLGDRVMFEKEEAQRPSDVLGYQGAGISAWMHASLGDATGARRILKQALLQGNSGSLYKYQIMGWGMEAPLDPHQYGDLLQQLDDLEKRLRARY